MSEEAKPREVTPEVAEWLRLSGMLISAASDYAASGREDEATSAMMRQIQVTAAALNAALNAVQQSGLGGAPARPFPTVSQPLPMPNPAPMAPRSY